MKARHHGLGAHAWMGGARFEVVLPVFLEAVLRRIPLQCCGPSAGAFVYPDRRSPCPE
jgi:hypothetical protein